MTRRGPREIQLTVVRLDDDGLGEGRFEDRVVRARNALPGETARVRVLRRRRGTWFGEADTPESGAGERQRPPCPNYPRCGGCALQHLDYPAQLRHKAAYLERLLKAHQVVPERWRAPVFGPQFHYRYKARLGVRVVGDELLMGFREGFSNRVVRMDDCKTLALPFARMLPALKRTLARLGSPHRIPQVELAGGDFDSAVIVRHLDPLVDRDTEELAAFEAATGIRVFVQPGGYDTVAPLTAATPPHLAYLNPELGLRYRFRPTDFTQVNPFMNRVLVRNALLALGPVSGRVAVDLFCGIGNFSLALARTGAHVYGYDAAGAVQRALCNAADNGLSQRAEFAVADLYDARCPALPQADVMLLDPPRSGAGVNLERWVDSPRLQRIAYVSCNPQTFASDAARLQAAGFVLKEAGIFDMFPHTAHVETLGAFQRRPDGHRG